MDTLSYTNHTGKRYEHTVHPCTVLSVFFSIEGGYFSWIKAMFESVCPCVK